MTPLPPLRGGGGGAEGYRPFDESTSPPRPASALGPEGEAERERRRRKTTRRTGCKADPVYVGEVYTYAKVGVGTEREDGVVGPSHRRPIKRCKGKGTKLILVKHPTTLSCPPPSSRVHHQDDGGTTGSVTDPWSKPHPTPLFLNLGIRGTRHRCDDPNSPKVST